MSSSGRPIPHDVVARRPSQQPDAEAPKVDPRDDLGTFLMAGGSNESTLGQKNETVSAPGSGTRPTASVWLFLALVIAAASVYALNRGIYVSSNIEVGNRFAVKYCNYYHLTGERHVARAMGEQAAIVASYQCPILGGSIE